MFSLPDLVETEQLAKKLAPLLKSGDVVALQGELGAGKTTFARALLQALGVKGEVSSPTFTLLQTYEVPNLTISHFDLYRLKNESELEELGWDEACAQSLVIVEWPERAQHHMPEDYLTLRFTLEKNQRQCGLEAHGAWAERLKGFS